MASSGKEFEFDLENGGKEIIPNKRPAKEKTLNQSKSTLVKSIEFITEKQKKNAARKAQKPPRSPNGPTLDAADLRFIREVLAHIARKKRAKIQRIKQAKKIEELPKNHHQVDHLILSVSYLPRTLHFFFLVMYFLG